MSFHVRACLLVGLKHGQYVLHGLGGAALVTRHTLDVRKFETYHRCLPQVAK